MNKLPLLLLLASALSLMSCATGAKMQSQPVAGGTQISFPGQHISFFLPEGWQIMPKTKGEGRLLGAARANDGGAEGGMVFALVTAPDTSHSGAADPMLAKDLQYSWSRKGFTKFSKQLVTVGGREALRFEARKPGSSQSLLNYTFIDRGRMVGLHFAYYDMPVTRGPAVQRIVDSFSITR